MPQITQPAVPAGHGRKCGCRTSQSGRLRGLVLLARLELVRVLQVVERRASTAPGVQRTGEVAASVAVAVWDEDPGYRGGEAGAAGTR
jgi:hypothetical protein